MTRQREAGAGATLSGSSTHSSAIEELPPRASILLVDDQPARLLTYEAVLAGLGVHCVRAQSGAEALEQLLVQEFAVILLDVQMPQMDGFEVARLIRQNPRLERTPIIFVTGVHISELDQLRGYEVGAIDYISVPIIPGILRSKVALLVELHLRRQELQQLNQAAQETRARIDAEHARALADREAQLRAVFEHPDQVTFVLQAVRDATGAVQSWVCRNANSNALALLGLPREALIGSSVSQVLPSERIARVAALCQRVLDSQSPVRYENSFAGRDFIATAFPADQDTVISTGVDITARKHAEAALRESERRSQALIEYAPVAIAHNGMDGRFEYVNQAFCELVGYTSQELRARTWQEITHPDDVERERALASDVLCGMLSHYTIEKRYLRSDGTHAWISLYGNFVRDDAGRPIQGVAIAVDITERKRNDRALRQHQERLLLAKRAALLGIHDWDIAAGVLEWDERVRELWGLSADEPVTYEKFMAGLHPEDRESTQQAVDRALDPAGTGQYTAVYRVISSSDHATRWVEATGRVFFESGRPVRLVGTAQDITDRRLAEERLRASQAALEEADRRKDEFLAMLAHELRNPLAPIASASEVLSRLLAHDDKSRALVAMIKRQSSHLSRILDDLLDVARITQGRIELRREVVTVASCIDMAIETVQPLVRAKGHQLTVTKTGQPLYVRADKVRLAQCLSNLLTNAAKYTDPGGEIRVRLHMQAAEAVIEVADNGIGLTAEFLLRAFDLFAQSERTLDRSQGGLGIGLSICKRLIEMHGGSVSCMSPGVGQGATFTLRLPLIEQHDRPNDASAAASRVALRVLIVDDNRDAADSLSMCLQLDGHQTMTVYSAESALERVTAFAPKIVLVDIGLPQMDGYVLAQRLRPLAADARLIALTGYGRAEDRERAFAAGFAAHYTKPVDIAALRSELMTSTPAP